MLMLRRTLLAAVVGLLFAAIPALATAASPPLLGDWNFVSGSGTDLSGNWSSFTLHGNAYFSDGLVVSGTGNGPDAATGWGNAGGYSGPTIGDKTLVSWVRIDNPAVLSGSPISVYKPEASGQDVFDAVDYGEINPDQWMAGSDFFHRTQPFVPGAVDSGGVTSQVAISYQDQGNGTERITGCLNGNLLGSYTTGNIARFAALEQPQALFGPRHRVDVLGGAPVGSIDAHVMESRIYGGAMTCQEVANLAATTTSVNCAPASVVAGNATTCTATVSEADSADPNTPTGTVSFTSSGPGSFSDSGSCTLSGSGGSASCSVTYTPDSTPATPVRSDTITASYGGDDLHTGSSGSAQVTVTSLPTSKDQCKNGGWQQYGVFKNQGDCVSFVATGGNNAAG
jgi:hypothetical protein